jgi:hypothetical protein
MQKRSENELEMQKALSEVQQAARSDDDDDAEWYRQEVGENPEKGKHIDPIMPLVYITVTGLVHQGIEEGEFFALRIRICS